MLRVCLPNIITRRYRVSAATPAVYLQAHFPHSNPPSQTCQTPISTTYDNMFGRLHTAARASDCSTQTSTPAKLNTFRRDTIWFSCLYCGRCTRFERSSRLAYPPGSCSDCGMDWSKWHGPDEETRRSFTPKTPFDYPSHDVSPENAQHSNTSTHCFRNQDVNQKKPSSRHTNSVHASGSKQSKRADQSATTVLKATGSTSIDGAAIIERIDKLNGADTAMQREQLAIINNISETTKQLLDSQKHFHASHATLQEENSRLRMENQVLSARVDGLIADCGKFEARLRNFTQHRRSVMMTESSDDEDL